jgi:hypothetical protein
VLCVLVCVAILTATSAFAATEIQHIFVCNIPELLNGEPLSTEPIAVFGGWDSSEGFNQDSTCWDPAKTSISNRLSFHFN